MAHRTSGWVVSLLIGAAVTACGSDADPPPVGDATAVVERYAYQFDLESRAAISTLSLRLTSPGNCVTLTVRAGGLADVTIDGEVAGGELVGTELKVCGIGWEADTVIELAASVTVPEQTWDDSQVGYSVTTDSEGGAFRYLVSWVEGCDQFGPCDVRPSEFATYQFEVTHPQQTTVLCPGTVVSQSGLTTCTFDYAGGPTYSTFGIVAADTWTESDLGDWNGVAVTLFDMDSSGTAAAIDGAQHADFLDFMTDHFGPYPYGDELRLIVGPTFWNGFEHPGNITLSDGLASAIGSAYSNPLAHTINHELAHMWAGDQTTLATTYDFVWKEAMAEYLSFVFDDERVDPAVAARTANAWKLFSSGAQFYPVPAERPTLIDYYGDVYGPGPMILFRQIAAMYSRETVMNALAMLLGQPRAIGIDDVKTALESATGADLTAYFDAWVYGEGTPTRPQFTVSVTDAGAGAYDVTVTQVAAAEGLFGCAFAVRLEGGADEEFDVEFNLGAGGMATATQTVTPGFVVVGHEFDPLDQTLASESTAAGPAPARGPSINPWLSGRVLVPYSHDH